jgi:hypothetical protein
MDAIEIDALEEPMAWRRVAVEACLETWLFGASRYERRLARRVLMRDPAEDLLALAARRVLPLPRRIVRPLPDEGPGQELVFNRLEGADRRTLLAWAAGWPELRGVDPRALGEHRASALQRLLDGLLARADKEARRPLRA